MIIGIRRLSTRLPSRLKTGKQLSPASLQLQRFFPYQYSTMADYKTVFTKDAAPPAGPYSQAIATSQTIYCSGQIPCNAAGEILTLSTSSISEMTELCIKNLAAVLKAAGSDISKVVKVNVFLTTMDNFAEMNGTYEKWFTHKPARSCVAVYQLPKGVPVEIECIALA